MYPAAVVAQSVTTQYSKYPKIKIYGGTTKTSYKVQAKALKAFLLLAANLEH
jgi:hypothetical protein